MILRSRAAAAGIAALLSLTVWLEPVLAAPTPAPARVVRRPAKPRPLPAARLDAYGRPVVPAASAVLMDASNGEVLFEKNSGTRRPIASTTKILTAVVVLERANLDTPFRIQKAAVRVGESSAELVAGELRTPRELLYALLLRSGNDAAAALAMKVGRSIAGFSRMMNEKAKEIGATRTHFSNPHGLTAPKNYSTARDLALISAYAMKNPLFARIVKTKQKKIAGKPYARVYTNHNRLLWDYRGAVGIKTGYTIPAGNCLVAAARRGSSTLIAVTLKSPSSADSYLATSFLLDYGFSHFKSGPAIVKGTTYALLPVAQLPGVTAHLVAGSSASPGIFQAGQEPTITCLMPPYANAPLSKGEVLGEVRIVRGDVVLARVPLLADADVEAPTFWDRLAVVGLDAARRTQFDSPASVSQ